MYKHKFLRVLEFSTSLESISFSHTRNTITFWDSERFDAREERKKKHCVAKSSGSIAWSWSLLPGLFCMDRSWLLHLPQQRSHGKDPGSTFTARSAWALSATTLFACMCAGKFLFTQGFVEKMLMKVK